MILFGVFKTNFPLTLTSKPNFPKCIFIVFLISVTPMSLSNQPSYSIVSKLWNITNSEHPYSDTLLYVPFRFWEVCPVSFSSYSCICMYSQPRNNSHIFVFLPALLSWQSYNTCQHVLEKVFRSKYFVLDFIKKQWRFSNQFWVHVFQQVT